MKESLRQQLEAASALLLDMDGTLLDSEPLYTQARGWAAEQMGFHYDDELARIGHGRKSSEFLDELRLRAGNDFDPSQFRQLQRQYRRDNNVDELIQFIPGAEALLEWVRDNNKPSALVTSSGRTHVDRMLVRFPLLQVLNHTITSDDVAHNKPHPAPYLMACKLLSVSPATAIAVEDSEPGMQSARTAGCQIIHVSDISNAF
ncbi:HAD family hydrolase [Spongorhabdus nitratireducens]